MPETSQLSPGILASRGRYRKNGDLYAIGGFAPELDPTDWQNYKALAESAIRSLEGCPTGLAMIQAISAARHGVTIGTPVAGQDGTCGGNACISLGDSQYYPKLASPASLQTVLLAAMVHINRGSLTLAAPSQMTALEAYAGMRDIVGRLAQVVWKSPPHPWNARWQIESLDWKPMCEPLARYVFERFLRGGTGAPAVVLWAPTSTAFEKEYAQREKKNKLTSEQAKAVANRPAFIGLGHELVHAWRGLCGRGIFGPGEKDDERMTVGLPITKLSKKTGLDQGTRKTQGPFHAELGPLVEGLRHGLPSNQFTENALRREHGQPERPRY